MGKPVAPFLFPIEAPGASFQREGAKERQDATLVKIIRASRIRVGLGSKNQFLPPSTPRPQSVASSIAHFGATGGTIFRVNY
jgi:hypothetical protein